MKVLVRPYRAIIVGEAMPPDPDVEEPLCIHTKTGRRLASVLPGDYETEYRRVNLIEHRVWVHRWRVWHRNRARAAALRMFSPYEIHEAATVILLGQQVTEAFGLEYSPPLADGRILFTDLRAIIMPHPSGRNRWWNETRNVSRASRFLEERIG